MRENEMTNNNKFVSVLVVDNDQMSCDEVSKTLAVEGFECVSASDAASAMRYCKKQIPNLVIANIDLDGLSASQFSQAIREMHPNCEIPFIHICASQQDNRLHESREAGAIFFLTRPLDPTVLVELVDKALWLPHLIRRHVDVHTHRPDMKGPKVMEVAKEKVGNSE